MATQREIKKRIESVKNTKKITKTMEMVATAKMKKMQDRVNSSKPYVDMLKKTIANLSTAVGDSSDNPFFQQKSQSNVTLVLIITGNRGLCGGFNNNVLVNTEAFVKELKSQDKEVILYPIGKKVINYLKSKGTSTYKKMLNLEDKITFDDARDLANDLIEIFQNNRVDEIYVSYTKVLSLAKYKPAVEKILPISKELGEAEEAVISDVEYIFEPDPERILNQVLPLFIKVQLYLYQIESGYAEQVARRIAMKNATDAAGDMIKELTVRYNRARQAKITNEIAEICGGAAALEK